MTTTILLCECEKQTVINSVCRYVGNYIVSRLETLINFFWKLLFKFSCIVSQKRLDQMTSIEWLDSAHVNTWNELLTIKKPRKFAITFKSTKFKFFIWYFNILLLFLFADKPSSRNHEVSVNPFLFKASCSERCNSCSASHNYYSMTINFMKLYLFTGCKKNLLSSEQLHRHRLWFNKANGHGYAWSKMHYFFMHLEFIILLKELVAPLVFQHWNLWMWTIH